MCFLPRFNGTTTFVHELPFKAHTIEIDACLLSVGGVWDNKVYTAPIPGYWKAKNLSITHFEMLNIIVALHLWKYEWRNKCINLLVDNEAVVSICSKGFTRDSTLAMYARNIWLITSVLDIELIVVHVPGHKNQQADLLSRWKYYSKEHMEKLNQFVPDHRWEIVQEAYFEVNTEI